MFKIIWSRDVFADTPEKRNKIRGIHIFCGYHCYIAYDCDCGRKCKYRKNFTKLHNFSVRIHRFFEYRLHIKLPHLLYISKDSNDMSGTILCPFKKPRRYTCYDCKSCAGVDENIDTICINKERRKLFEEKRGKEAYNDDYTRAHCEFFDKVDYADDYDKRTGGIVSTEKPKKSIRKKK